MISTPFLGIFWMPRLTTSRKLSIVNALTTHNEFPIFTTQYDFCKEGYFLAVKDTCDYIEKLAKSVERTRTKLVYLAEDSSYLTAKEIAAMKIHSK